MFANHIDKISRILCGYLQLIKFRALRTERFDDTGFCSKVGWTLNPRHAFMHKNEQAVGKKMVKTERSIVFTDSSAELITIIQPEKGIKHRKHWSFVKGIFFFF